MFSKFVDTFKNSLGTSGTSTRKSRSKKKPNYDDDEIEDRVGASSSSSESVCPERNAYCRPNFLQLTKQEQESALSHQNRPVIVPKDVKCIPLGAGYAECINGGKSARNEDQAAVANFVLSNQPNGTVDNNKKPERLEVQYFGIFDGHAGVGASLMAADQLINHLQEKLFQIQDDLSGIKTHRSSTNPRDIAPSKITNDCLVMGALEAAFVSFDEQIAHESYSFNISGGCAAIVALVMMNKIYVAHAGDCRAVAFIGNEICVLASEFTPETDGKRIQYLAHVSPALTHSLFSDNYFLHSLGKKDIGTQVLCRGPQRSGWHYKEVTDEDVYKYPLVCGQGKWARLMGIIGVTRGFGDHGLVIPNTKIHVKPFLTAVPEVRAFDLAGRTITEDDVLVIGCDGLWDMLKNEQVGSAVKASLAKSQEDGALDKYTRAAQELVLLARGDNTGKGWKMKEGQDASFDDITAFIIPLHRCISKENKV